MQEKKAAWEKELNIWWWWYNEHESKNAGNVRIM
jgi:hypothetical protein